MLQTFHYDNYQLSAAFIFVQLWSMKIHENNKDSAEVLLFKLSYVLYIICLKMKKRKKKIRKPSRAYVTVRPFLIVW
jgi:hypothetical protein